MSFGYGSIAVLLLNLELSALFAGGDDRPKSGIVGHDDDRRIIRLFVSMALTAATFLQ